MRNPPQGVRIIEVNPPDTFQTKRLTKNVSVLKQDYRTGYEMSLEIMIQWKSQQTGITKFIHNPFRKSLIRLEIMPYLNQRPIISEELLLTTNIH